MPKYIVQDTHIKHGKPGAKGPMASKLYGPGDEIELSAAEAEDLGAAVKPAPEPELKGKKAGSTAEDEKGK